MKTFSLIVAPATLFLSACDRHEWESKDGEMGTKELYKHGEEGHDGHHDEKGHGEHDKGHDEHEADAHKKEESAH